MTNKLVILDLDGVLLDSREIHYNSLNNALRDYYQQAVISREEHLSVYDGLPTTKKLQMLTNTKGLPSSLHNDIWKAKQEYTLLEYAMIKPNQKNIDILIQLKLLGYSIAVASNSVRSTLKQALLFMGILPWVDYYVSNEDVKRPKPAVDMYFKCMMAMDAVPSTTIIVEDSHIGRQGALASGARLVPVENVDGFTLDFIKANFSDLPEFNPKIPWINKKMNVLIPMAGAGSRFAAAGYTFPKPLIEVRGKPMIQMVVENLNIDANYIFIVQKEHYEKYNLGQMLSLIKPGCTVVQVDGLTEGAACTTMLARKFIDNDDPLVIANSDQYLDWNSNEVMYAFAADGIDGGIVTFKSTHPKWSFAKVGKDGFVDQIAEKNPISDDATVGVYYWSKGSDYCRSVDKMIAASDRTNGEFYVAPTINYLIAEGKKFRVKEIQGMWGTGTPEDLNYFLENHG